MISKAVIQYIKERTQLWDITNNDTTRLCPLSFKDWTQRITAPLCEMDYQHNGESEFILFELDITDDARCRLLSVQLYQKDTNDSFCWFTTQSSHYDLNTAILLPYATNSSLVVDFDKLKRLESFAYQKALFITECL